MAIYRGTYFSKDIQFKDRSTGQPIDVSVWQFEAVLRDQDGEDVLEMSTSTGEFTVFDGPNGWMRFALTPAKTEALAAGPVAFSVYRTDNANGPIRLFHAEDIVREKD